MEDDQKVSIKEWKGVLKYYLDPQKIMDDLPGLFGINSDLRGKVEAKIPNASCHEAVVLLLDELMNLQGSFHPLMEAINKYHDWLPPLITGKIEDDELCPMVEVDHGKYIKYISKFLSILLPEMIKSLFANETAQRLKELEILDEEEQERIEARVRNHGNSDGVRFLMSILARKKIGWQKVFKQVLEEKNYNADLRKCLKDLPDDPTSYHFMSSCETETNYEELKPAASNLKQREMSSVAFYEDDVFQKDAQQPNFEIRMQELHGTHYNSPSNKIIPKEAQISTSMAKSRQPVHGEESLLPEHSKIAQAPIRGANVVICTPESTERLQMIVHIIQSRFPHILDSEDRKIAIVVSTIMKKHDFFKTSFASQQWNVAYFKESDARELSVVMKSHQVAVITSEALSNWLTKGSEVRRITEFDILIIDECEKAIFDGPQREILEKYHEEKQSRQSNDLPQMIGLLSNAGKSSNKSDALKYVKKVCALLDARDGIEVAMAAKESNPKKDAKTVSRKMSSKNCIQDPFTYILCDSIDEIVDKVLDLLCKQIGKNLERPRYKVKGSAEYNMWCKDLADNISSMTDQHIKRDFIWCKTALQALNNAVFIKTRCRAIDALNILEKEFNELSTTHSSTKPRTAEKRIHNILTTCIARLKVYVSDVRVANAVLNDMEKKLVAQFKGNASSKVILLMSDKTLLKPMEGWLQSTSISDCFTITHLEDKASTSTSAKHKKATAFFKTRGGEVMISLACFYGNTIQCDLILLYDCDIAKSGTKKKNGMKPPNTVVYTPQVVIADNKVQVEKSLLVEMAANTIRESRSQDEDEYHQDLKKIQATLLQLPQLTSHRRLSRRER